MDLGGEGAEEFLEQRDGLRELCGQVPADFLYGCLGQAGDQDVSIDADG